MAFRVQSHNLTLFFRLPELKTVAALDGWAVLRSERSNLRALCARGKYAWLLNWAFTHGGSEVAAGCDQTHLAVLHLLRIPIRLGSFVRCGIVLGQTRRGTKCVELAFKHEFKSTTLF